MFFFLALLIEKRVLYFEEMLVTCNPSFQVVQRPSPLKTYTLAQFKVLAVQADAEQGCACADGRVSAGGRAMSFNIIRP